MREPEVYVLRIYRRARSNGRQIAGVVEVVETGIRHPFTNAAGLWAIVASGQVHIRASKKPRRKMPSAE
jgi:hypothetical protein